MKNFGQGAINSLVDGVTETQVIPTSADLKLLLHASEIGQRISTPMSSEQLKGLLILTVEKYLEEYPGYDEEDFVDFVISQRHGSKGTGLLSKMPFGIHGLIAFYERRIVHLRDWVAQTNKEDEHNAKVGRK